MTKSIVDRLYVQGNHTEYQLSKKVEVAVRAPHPPAVEGTVGEVLGNVCLKRINELGIETQGIYGEPYDAFVERFDGELRTLAKTNPGALDPVLKAAFGAQEVELLVA